VIIASMQVISPTHEIVHVPSLHPPVHSGGHAPLGGVGSSLHSSGPVVVAVVSPVEPVSVVDVLADVDEPTLLSPVVVAFDEPEVSAGPLSVPPDEAPSSSAAHAASRIAIGSVHVRAMPSG
jgi:hypothetical protein